MSAALRTGQRFGAGHIVDVLLGKETEKTKKFNHEKIKTFGVGAELPAEEWKQIARQMVAGGLLSSDEYGSLRATEKGLKVLRGEEKTYFRREEKPPPNVREKHQRTAKSRAAKEKTENALSDTEQEVFEVLREERLRLSIRQNVPAYIIFQNTVLYEMARQMPATEEEFAALPGVGAAKVERYAKNFLKILAECRKDGEK